MDFDNDFRHKRDDGKTFWAAASVYLLVSVLSFGALLPVALVIGVIHYLIWKASRP